jgi:isopentenyl diphosphate isomerase/L-lactate dehydrogenase-like FMN-dependent dehydrogenase
VQALELLEKEMVTAMALLGVCSLNELGPQHLRSAMPMNPPHAFSAYPLFNERFGL